MTDNSRIGRPGFSQAWLLAKRAQSAVSKEEAQVLWDAALSCPKEVVEVGSWHGRCAVLLAHAVASQGGRVTTIDPFDGTVGVGGTHFDSSNRRILQSNLRRLAPPGVVTHLPVPSVEAAAAWEGRPVSLLWIDGDHTLEGVRADVEAWTPHLADYARFAFHDVDMDGPGAVVEELLGAGWESVGSAGCLRVLRRPVVRCPGALAGRQ